MKKKLITDRRLWLTADRDHVVEDGDPAAAFLFVARAGREIPADEASRLQLKIVRPCTPMLCSAVSRRRST